MMEINSFVKPSNIHGLGLFASVDIKKGEIIIHGKADYDNYRDEWIRYVKKCKLKSFTFNNGFCMINHADTPNTYREGEDLSIIASRDIAKDEEITEDYNQLEPDHNPFTSLVGIIQEAVYQYS